MTREWSKHDQQGRLLCNALDVCDCLQIKCSESFYLCLKGNSKKCGVQWCCECERIYNKGEELSGDLVNALPVTCSH